MDNNCICVNVWLKSMIWPTVRYPIKCLQNNYPTWVVTFLERPTEHIYYTVSAVLVLLSAKNTL